MADQNYKIRFKIANSELEIEGDKTFVDEKFTLLLKELRLNPTNFQYQGSNSPEIQNPSTAPQPPSGKIPIKQFIAEKKPSGSLQVAVVIAYYIWKYEGKETFPSDYLKQIWIASGCKPSNNLKQTLIDCKTKHGWIEMPTRGLYKISEHGIYLVESELPIKKGGV